MRKISFLIFNLFSIAALAGSVSGTVTIDKKLAIELKGGTLFIFAKNAGSKAGDGQMPVAVQRIPNPTFPVSFELSGENTMIKGTPFDGPFSIYARYSASGDATDKSGPQGATAKNKKVNVGDKSIKIELKK